MNSLEKPYTALPSYADVSYVDGKLSVAAGIIRRASGEALRLRWLETVDILLDQRLALSSLEVESGH